MNLLEYRSVIWLVPNELLNPKHLACIWKKQDTLTHLYLYWENAWSSYVSIKVHGPYLFLFNFFCYFCMYVFFFTLVLSNFRDKKMIPLRESKLTRLFSGHFLGKGRAVMIANASPCEYTFDETLNVLRFSALCKTVCFCFIKPAILLVIYEYKCVHSMDRNSIDLPAQHMKISPSIRLKVVLLWTYLRPFWYYTFHCCVHIFSKIIINYKSNFCKVMIFFGSL